MPYDERTVVKTAILYYLKNLDQDEIAQRLGLSRQSVSRHLKRARETGIVRFAINAPNEDAFAGLELELESAFGLKAAVVAPVNMDLDDIIKDEIGKYAADFIEQNIRDGDILGVSWSSTVYSCARRIKWNGAKGLTICQLNGSMDVADCSTRAEFIISMIASAFRARTNSLPAPMIVDSPEILKSIMADSRIRGSFEVAQRASIGIFGIGCINEQSSLYRTGYLSHSMLEDLRRKGIVGDIAGHFFDGEGTLRDSELESRTLAVPAESFRAMRLSIALAGGASKLEAIEGALAGKWCNVLVTDEITARRLIERRSAAMRKAAQ